MGRRADPGTSAILAAILCCLGVLQGCARYQAQPLDPAASAQGLQARSLKDPHLLHFVSTSLRRPGSQVRWDLAALTVAAAYERPDARIAFGQIQAAEAGEHTAAEWTNPVLSLNTSYYTAVFDPSPWEAGPSISQLIQTPAR